jgi:cell pole-organizing protein PopZ
MSSPEASIEEILASIRKTFTDEPEAQGSKSAESYSETRPSGMPPFRSVTESALAAGTTPLPTPPRSRAAAIDDDLDDLIDKSSFEKSSPVKSPAALSEPVVPQPTVPQPTVTVSPVEAAREKWANLLNPHSQSNGSAAKVAEVKSEAAPQPTSPAPAPATAPSSGLFAPRKGGFYPPQDSRADPILPMPAAAPPPAPAPAENASPATPVFGASAGLAKETPPASAAPRPGFIPFPQTKSTAPEPSPAPAPATLSGATMAMTAPAATAPAVSAASASVADVPAASARALDDLVAELNGVAHVPAESAAAAPVIPSEPPAPAPTSMSQTEPAATTKATAAVPATATGTEAASPASASRSFEDVVADMLRPLLEKWIDENMPRIVERALQRDAALGRKPGQ